MIKALLNKLFMVLYYIVGAMILELVTFHILGLGVAPDYFFMNFAILFFGAILVFAIPNYTAQYVVYSVLLVIQAIFMYVNYSLMTIYGDLFSIEMLNLVGEANAAITANFVYFSVILQLISVVLSILIIGGIMLRHCKKEKINIKQHFSVFNVIILIACESFSLGYVVDKRHEISDYKSMYVTSDAFLMNTSIMKTSSYKKFGTFGYFTNLVFNKFSDFNASQIDATISYFNSGKIINETNLAKVSDGETEKEINMFGAANRTSGDIETKQENVIVVMMESLEWFCFGDGTYDPTLENLSSSTAQVLMPNMFSLISSDRTMSAQNFFAKSKTNYSEAFGILGYYPIGGALAETAGENYDKSSNAFGYSMPNILDEKGYNTTYIHSHNSSFYDRNLTHNNIGFANFYSRENLTDADGNRIYSGGEIEWAHWDGEGEFAKKSIDKIIPYDETSTENQPFYTFYLTVSTHGGYEYSETELDSMRYRDFVMFGPDLCEKVNITFDGKTTWVYKLKDEVKAECNFDEDNSKYVLKNDSTYSYSDWYKNVLKNYSSDDELINMLIYYQSAACGLDEAIGVIVDTLKTKGIYDNTTLLLYSDHYSYYNLLSNRIKNKPLTEIGDIELNTIPMIISSKCLEEYYNPEFNEKRNGIYYYDRFCSAYDVIPTLLDMLGIPFNENLYVGRSLFRATDYTYQIGTQTKEMVIYYSNTGGLFSKDLYTYDFSKFIKQNYMADENTIKVFKSEAINILQKINYLQILNTYKLYSRLK